MAESTKPSSSKTTNPPENPQHFPPTPLNQRSDIQNIEDSQIYKMRSLLGDLRPLVMEAIQAPDLRNCNAAADIREKMKLFMDEYRELTSETGTGSQSTALPEGHLTGLPLHPQHPQKLSSEASSSSPFMSKCTTTMPGTSQQIPSPTPLRVHSADQDSDESPIPGPYYIVGSSPPGWKFIVYPEGNPPVYCGVTKAMHKLATKSKAKAAKSPSTKSATKEKPSSRKR